MSNWIKVTDRIPKVKLGTEEMFWIAVAINYKGERYQSTNGIKVISGLFQNRPIDTEQDAEADWALYSPDDEVIDSVGWVTDKSHCDFDNFYEQITESDEYKVIAWMDYFTPPPPEDNNNV